MTYEQNQGLTDRGGAEYLIETKRPSATNLDRIQLEFEKSVRNRFSNSDF